MRTSQRIFALIFTIAVATLFTTSSAGAAPKSDEPFTLNCPGGAVAVITPPGRGDYTPGFIVGTNQHFIPYSFTFTLTDAEGNVIESETLAKGAPLPADAVTCFLREPAPNGGTFTVEVTAVVRGAP